MDSVPTNNGRWAMGDGVFAVLVGKRTLAALVGYI